MVAKKLIFVLTAPASGHINPMCGLVNALCKHRDVRVVFYSDECYRSLIEKTGAQFRAYSHLTFSLIKLNPITERNMPFAGLLNIMIDFSHNLIPQLIADVELDEPDCILYDCVLSTAKYLIEIIKSRDAKGTWNRTVPKTVGFIPNFPLGPKMIKEFREISNEDIWSLLALVESFRRQVAFSWKFNISMYNPLAVITKADPVMNIVAVAPELQPHRQEYDDRYKFVGSCVSEEARSVERIDDDEEFMDLLAQFDKKQKKSSTHSLKLIYMALGTIFNGNSFIYERAFEALSQTRNIKSDQIRMIVSLSESSIEHFKARVDRGELKLPENVLLRTRVPQLDVLKRADLFITHCGMNSTTETIKYAVPIVALPLRADQPMVARQVCDELGFGVKLNPIKFTSQELAEAIDRVLSEPKYKTNISEMSKLLNRHEGADEGARLIVDYIKQKSN